MKNYIVFFDFDNTITSYDVIDDMLSRFSVNDKWISLEAQWKRGEIDSRKCLKGQVREIRLTKRSLDRYLDNVTLDPYFKKVMALLESKNIKVIILSDNFDYIVNRILRNNNINGVDVYTNSLKIIGDRLIPGFPFTNKKCGRCGHCKKDNLIANSPNGARTIYIGDGLSDTDPAQCADIVFAKDELMRYFMDRRLQCIPFNSLKDVYKYFKENFA
ncbi:MAG: MtnX-like HAD-IB family phosphatase [Candidatus Omnitrophota bacterium]